MLRTRTQEGRWLVDSKQAVFAFIGVAFGFGFLFLVGAHTYRMIRGEPARDAEGKLTPGEDDSPQRKPLRTIHKLQAVTADLDTYAFFSLLDSPAPHRDAPFVSVAASSLVKPPHAAASTPAPPTKPPASPPKLAAASKKPAPTSPPKLAAAPPKPPAKPSAQDAKLGARANAPLQASSSLTAHSFQPAPVGAALPTELLEIDFQAPPAAPPSNEKPQQGTGRARFTVQVGSFKERESAERLEQALSARGYEVHLKREAVPGQGTMHRVRVGRFQDRDDAERFRKRLHPSEGQGSIVTGM
jgi:hypothetical protein